jgi:hypothetical protein
VSELRESGQLDRIVKALATYAKGTYVEAGEIEGLGSPSFGAAAAAWSYFRRLGLEEHFSSLGRCWTNPFQLDNRGPNLWVGPRG